MSRRKPQFDALYTPDEWLSLPDFSALAVSRICKQRSCTPAEVDDVEIKVAIAEQVLKSPMFTIRNFFYTDTKAGPIVQLEPFNGQLLLDIAIESQRRAEVAQRVVEIKPRQLGWTSWNIARGFWYALQPNKIVVLYVDDEEVVARQSQKIATIFNNLGWLAPMVRIYNQREIIFENPDQKLREIDGGLNASFTVAPPGSKRGKTPHVAILSEFAFTPNKEDLFDGVMSGMSAGVESCVIIDTTPNGYDETYYPLVKEAIANNPEWVKRWDPEYIQRFIPSGVPTRQDLISGLFGRPDNPEDGWVPVFWPWFWHEQYTTKDESPIGQRPKMSAKSRAWIKDTLGKLEEYGGEEELELHERYKVSIPRLSWRRWKIKNDTEGTDIRMKLLTHRQEYATTWESCFIDYGEGAFDPKGMDVISRMGRDTPYYGLLRKCEGITLRWEIDQQAASEWEVMRFYAPPEGNDQYVIGVDLGWSFETKAADRTVAQVLRRRDLKQVAVYESRAPMFRVRPALYALYMYYNRAYMGIETKGPGKQLVRELWDMGCTNQYRWKRLDTIDLKETNYLGWETNQHTRDGMQGILCEEIARRDSAGRPDPGVILRDRETIQELLSCKRYPDGKIKGRSGSHDDHADALMIALAIHRDPFNPYFPPRPQQQRELEMALSWPQRRGMYDSDRNHPSLRDL